MLQHEGKLYLTEE
jgi:hypothetical protein